MDQNQPQQDIQIEQRLAELPEDVRAAVLSVEWEGKVAAIAARHKLHLDQAGVLADVTLMAMLGMVTLDNYPARLAADFSLPPQEAQAIAKEVSDEVFVSIRESLKKMAGATTFQAKPALPKPDLSAADAALHATAVQTAPAPYTTDPYREPPV
jgi:hypothetical protein